jgi:outer membrane protein
MRRVREFQVSVVYFFFVVASALQCGAQTSPSSPTPAQPAMQPQQQMSTQSPPQTPAGQRLTLAEAEGIAIQNHPRIQAASQLASAAAAQVREVQSVYYPQASGAATGAYAQTNSRIAAGFLNSPSVFDKFADGVSVSQLVTDFGRTHELSTSSHYHAQAQQENVVSTRADVLLRVNLTYYNVMKAQSVLHVAEETVKARQLVSDQITQLQKSSLRSGLDVSFANVDLARSQLLLVQAQNDLQSSFAQLSDALGYSDQRQFQLVEEPLPGAPPPDVTPLIVEALQNRPEIISQGFDVRSAQSYATAERDLWFPTISAAAVTGIVPFRQDVLPEHYAAAGFNVNVPIFNGRLFNAEHSEATARSHVQEQYLRDLQNRIAQDVRMSWLNAMSAYQRLSLTQQLLDQTTQAYDLAKGRYQLGLSSIIELSQAQLNLTEARVEQVSAQYDYESQTANLNYQLGRVK